MKLEIVRNTEFEGHLGGGAKETGGLLKRLLICIIAAVAVKIWKALKP